MTRHWKLGIGICLAVCAVGLVVGVSVQRLKHRRLVQAANATRARAEKGDAKAQNDIASMYLDGKGVPQNYAEALAWYSKAADQGNREAEYGLGFMFRNGKGVPQDYSQAINWCRRAADHGYAKAQYALGNAYYDGWQVSPDYAVGVALYRRSAEQGYAEGQYALGYAYYEGKGLPQSDSEAVGWYRKAAEQDFPPAESSLGYMYFQGKGVQRNYAKAAQWYRKAAEHGDAYSRQALAAMKIKIATPIKLILSITFAGSIFLLISSSKDIRNRRQQRAALAGLLGLLWVGLDVYGSYHFGILLALSAVNAFYFGKSLLSGICIAVFLSIVWPQGFKIALTICAMLFIGFNIYAMMHYDLRHLAACPRAFYSTNGILLGIAVASAFLLRLATKKADELRATITEAY